MVHEQTNKEADAHRPRVAVGGDLAAAAVVLGGRLQDHCAPAASSLALTNRSELFGRLPVYTKSQQSARTRVRHSRALRLSGCLAVCLLKLRRLAWPIIDMGAGSQLARHEHAVRP